MSPFSLCRRICFLIRFLVLFCVRADGQVHRFSNLDLDEGRQGTRRRTLIIFPIHFRLGFLGLILKLLFCAFQTLRGFDKYVSTSHFRIFV
jgi:hypothetical protein